MALNYPGPYEVRLFYTTPVTGSVSLTHQQRLNVVVSGQISVGDPFSSITVVRRDASLHALDDEVDAWVALINGLWNNSGTSTIDYAELWKYVPNTFDAIYTSTYQIGVVGTSGSANVGAAQNIITFRTQEGGIFKLNFLETIVGTGYKDTLPFSNGTLDTIADAVVAGTVPWLARDSSYPLSCIGLYPGASEALFKKRYRS